MTDVYDRTQEVEYQPHKCPDCSGNGLAKSSGPKRSEGLYEEVYVCPRCYITWMSVFTFVEKIVISKRGEE